MEKWLDDLSYSPLTMLLGGGKGHEGISLFTRRDLFDEKIDIYSLWDLPEAQKILAKQQPNGSWLYPGAKGGAIRTKESYHQLETFRNLGILIEQFGFDREYPAIVKIAEYFFSFQSSAGDLRIISGNQYSPYYTAATIELLIKAGYERDSRIEKVFEWLLSIRQNDGGWAIPIRTRNYNLDVVSSRHDCIEPNRSKPFSHLVTGIVLRAFAAHPHYKRSKDANEAGKLLLSRFFKKDVYPDRAAADFWFRFSFPFWFTDLISALDSLSRMDFSIEEPQIKKALQWFDEHQQKNGIWKLKLLKGRNKDILELWLALSLCRMYKRFEDQS